MFESCLNKQKNLEHLFLSCPTAEKKYDKIIELGQKLPKFQENFKQKENLVKGCQSELFLYTELNGGLADFHASSSSLISTGLAALLIFIYQQETPEVILKCPPLFFDKLGVNLSPNRSNGFYYIYQKMKKDILNTFLIKN